MVVSLCQIFNASTHFHKWGSKERPTLENRGPHNIIIDHQFNQFPIRGQRQLSRLFTFHCCSHISCVYCVYIMMSLKKIILILIPEIGKIQGFIYPQYTLA